MEGWLTGSRCQPIKWWYYFQWTTHPIATGNTFATFWTDLKADNNPKNNKMLLSYNDEAEVELSMLVPLWDDPLETSYVIRPYARKQRQVLPSQVSAYVIAIHLHVVQQTKNLETNRATKPLLIDSRMRMLQCFFSSRQRSYEQFGMSWQTGKKTKIDVFRFLWVQLVHGRQLR